MRTCNWCGQNLRTLPPSAVVTTGKPYPVSYHVQCKIKADATQRKTVIPLVRKLNKLVKRNEG